VYRGSEVSPGLGPGQAADRAVCPERPWWLPPRSCESVRATESRDDGRKCTCIKWPKCADHSQPLRSCVKRALLGVLKRSGWLAIPMPLPILWACNEAPVEADHRTLVLAGGPTCEDCEIAVNEVAVLGHPDDPASVAANPSARCRLGWLSTGEFVSGGLIGGETVLVYGSTGRAIRLSIGTENVPVIGMENVPVLRLPRGGSGAPDPATCETMPVPRRTTVLECEIDMEGGFTLWPSGDSHRPYRLPAVAATSCGPVAGSPGAPQPLGPWRERPASPKARHGLGARWKLTPRPPPSTGRSHTSGPWREGPSSAASRRWTTTLAIPSAAGAAGGCVPARLPDNPAGPTRPGDPFAPALR